MRNHRLIPCMLLSMLLLLGGCHHKNAAPPPPLPDAPLTYLYLSEHGSYFERVQGYEYCAKDGKHTAYFYMANEEEPYPVPVDQAWVDTLNSFIAEYGMMAWNGFHGSSPGLLDGTQFYVEFTLADGTTVTAGGYGDFPDGYSSASDAIDAHFLQLLPEEMRDW